MSSLVSAVGHASCWSTDHSAATSWGLQWSMLIVTRFQLFKDPISTKSAVHIAPDELCCRPLFYPNCKFSEFSGKIYILWQQYMYGIRAPCRNWYRPNLRDVQQYLFSSRVETCYWRIIYSWVSHLVSALAQDIAIILLLYIITQYYPGYYLIYVWLLFAYALLSRLLHLCLLPFFGE